MTEDKMNDDALEEISRELKDKAGIKDWTFEFRDGSRDGLTIHKTKQLIIGTNGGVGLLCHEIAHAMLPSGMGHCGLHADKMHWLFNIALRTLRSKTRKEDAECFKDAFKINYCSLFHKCDWKCFHFDKDGIAKGELPSEHDAWRIAHGQYCKGKLCEAQAILKKEEDEK